VRVLLLHNPFAGSGKASAAAERLSVTLRRAGHEPVLKATEAESSERWLDPALHDIDAMVVLGGDGAMRLASRAAADTGTPFYVFPFGTENLFAREFGFDRSVRRLVEALSRFEVRHLDRAIAGSVPFMLMASIGPDANAVRELAANRTGAISHLSYAAPLLRQLFGWRAPELSVSVDERPVVRGRRGMVWVANSRQYALRFDPAVSASMADGKLDVVFFPCRTTWGAMAWMVACRFRRQRMSSRMVYETGTHVTVRSDPEHTYQIDGEDPGPTSPTGELSITVHPATVPILVP